MGNGIVLPLESLNSFLLNDASDPLYRGYLGGRFPVRILYTDDFNVYVEILKTIKETLNPITVPLSEYCTKEDTLPDINRVLNDVQEGLRQEKILAISSLGEILRLNKRESPLYTPEVLLRNLHSIEIPPKTDGRLLLVLFGVSSFVNEYWRNASDTRRFPPIYVVSSQPNLHTFLKLRIVRDENLLEIAKDWGKNKVLGINGFREYLRVYEDPVLLKSLTRRILVANSRILTKYVVSGEFPGVEIEYLANIKDLAKHILGISIPFKYENSEISYWRQLITEMVSLNVFDVISYLKRKFNIQEFSDKQLLKEWNRYSMFEKWLVFNWMKHEIASLDNRYLKMILTAETVDYKSFEVSLWTYPLETSIELDLKQIAERRNLIELTESLPPAEFFELLSSIDNPLLRLKLLTGISQEEQVEIIRATGEALNEGINVKDITRILKVTYPELYHYVNLIPCWDSTEVEFICEYFKEYIASRLMNNPTTKLIELGEKFYKEEIYMKYRHRNSILSEFSEYPVVFVDALGIEWIGLLKWYLEANLPDHHIRVLIGKASIPTTTEFNKLPADTRILTDIKELDVVLHTTKYPENLVEEIRVIKNEIIKNNIQRIFGRKVIITSDHGATQFNGYIVDRIQVPFSVSGETKRDGRYMVINKVLSDLEDTDEYLVEVRNEKTYLVSKSYKVFPSGRRLHTETHGGATPEELLVPVIIISPPKEPEKLGDIRISVLTKEIKRVSPSLKVRIDTAISLDKIVLKIGNTRVEGEKKTEKTWVFNLKKLKLKPRKYKGTIISEELGVLGTVQFEIKSGMEEEDFGIL